VLDWALEGTTWRCPWGPVHRKVFSANLFGRCRRSGQGGAPTMLCSRTRPPGRGWLQLRGPFIKSKLIVLRRSYGWPKNSGSFRSKTTDPPSCFRFRKHCLTENARSSCFRFRNPAVFPFLKTNYPIAVCRAGGHRAECRRDHSCRNDQEDPEGHADQGHASGLHGRPAGVVRREILGKKKSLTFQIQLDLKSNARTPTYDRVDDLASGRAGVHGCEILLPAGSGAMTIFMAPTGDLLQ